MEGLYLWSAGFVFWQTRSSRATRGLLQPVCPASGACRTSFAQTQLPPPTFCCTPTCSLPLVHCLRWWSAKSHVAHQRGGCRRWWRPPAPQARQAAACFFFSCIAVCVPAPRLQAMLRAATGTPKTTACSCSATACATPGLPCLLAPCFSPCHRLAPSHACQRRLSACAVSALLCPANPCLALHLACQDSHSPELCTAPHALICLPPHSACHSAGHPSVRGQRPRRAGVRQAALRAAGGAHRAAAAGDAGEAGHTLAWRAAAADGPLCMC